MKTTGMKRRLNCLPSIIGLMVIGFVAGCIELRPRDQQLTEHISATMRSNGIQGMSIVVVDKDKVLYSRDFGYADRANNVPVTEETVFRIASVTKLFAATAIMQLVEDGKIDLDQPLVNYLPEHLIKTRPGIDATHADITIRHILTHRSGIPGDLAPNYLDPNPNISEFTALLADEYMAQTPESFWAYSNNAFITLADVIETVSEMPWQTYIQTQILDPLGMTSTSPDQPLPPAMAALMSKDYWNGQEFNQNDHVRMDLVYTAGAMTSTTTDMAKFAQMVLNRGSLNGNTILQSATLDTMFTQQYTDNNLDNKFGLIQGLGWWLYPNYTGGQVVAHGGNWQGHNGTLFISPNQELAVYIVANSNEAMLHVDALADRAMRLAMDEYRGIPYSLWQALIPDTTPPPGYIVPWSEAELTSHAGIYTVPGLPFEVKRIDDTLSMDLQMDPSVPELTLQLVKMNNGTIRTALDLLGTPFVMPGLEITFEVIDGYDLMTLGQELSYMKVANLLEKYEPATVTVPQAWLDRLGDYTDPDSIAYPDWQLAYEDDMLLLKLFAQGQVGKYVLIPYDDDRAYLHGVGRTAGETVWVDSLGKLHFWGLILESPAPAPLLAMQLSTASQASGEEAIDASVTDGDPRSLMFQLTLARIKAVVDALRN